MAIWFPLLDKAHVANIGNKTVAMNPFTGQMINSIDNTQSQTMQRLLGQPCAART